MSKIDILNQKLIIPDDYQQFLVHFEWFLALKAPPPTRCQFQRPLLVGLRQITSCRQVKTARKHP